MKKIKKVFKNRSKLSKEEKESINLQHKECLKNQKKYWK